MKLSTKRKKSTECTPYMAGPFDHSNLESKKNCCVFNIYANQKTCCVALVYHSSEQVVFTRGPAILRFHLGLWLCNVDKGTIRDEVLYELMTMLAIVPR